MHSVAFDVFIHTWQTATNYPTMPLCCAATVYHHQHHRTPNYAAVEMKLEYDGNSTVYHAVERIARMNGLKRLIDDNYSSGVWCFEIDEDLRSACLLLVFKVEKLIEIRCVG